MTPLLALLLGMALTLGLALMAQRWRGFLAQRPQDYRDKGPRFDLRRHLTGAIRCEGVIYGPMGRVTSRFIADMHATWEGDRGVMVEHFRYDSGAAQDREWRLQLGPDGGIRATATDFLGEAVGRAEGCAVQLHYRLQLDRASGGHVLDVTDWMYLLDNGTIINRSQFRKFGIKVGELVATLRMVDA